MKGPEINKGKLSQKDKTRSVMANYNNSGTGSMSEETEKKTNMPTSYVKTDEEEDKAKKRGRKQGKTKTAISITIDNELDKFLERKQKQTRLNKSLLVEDAIRGFYKNEIEE